MSGSVQCQSGCPCAKHRGRPAVLYSITGGYKILHGRYDHPVSTTDGKLGEHRMVLYDKIGPGSHACHWLSVYECGRDKLVWGGRGGNALYADHLDEDRLNNVPENLVPSCAACNARRSRKNSLTAADVRQIRAMHAQGMNNIQIGKAFGVTQGTVWNIVHRKIWQNVAEITQGQVPEMSLSSPSG